MMKMNSVPISNIPSESSIDEKLRLGHPSTTVVEEIDFAVDVSGHQHMRHVLMKRKRCVRTLLVGIP